MRTLNICGALIFAVVFLALAYGGSAYFPSDTSVHFSAESGFYDEPVTLEMTCEVPGAEIYYTLDGSVPTERSYYYDGPITLENVEDEFHTLSDYTGVSYDEEYVPEDSMLRANVVRAAVFRGGKRMGEVRSGTYFVGIDRASYYGDVPIVSLIMEEDDLFDYEKGIYILGAAYDEWYANWEGGDDFEWWDINANFFNRGPEWERPVHVEYLTSDGSEGFAQEMGMRINGAGSRKQMQKSLRLTARDEYGADRVRYPLFEDNLRGDKDGLVEDSYKSFVLRSGGNDASYAKIREPLIQNLARDMRLDTQRSAPCIVFINGEYWGLYSITERYGVHYIESNYDIEKENVIVIKAGELQEGLVSDYALYQDALDFIIRNDMTVPENYQQACNLLDIGNFADFFAVQLYADNIDGVIAYDNNWQMWRARTLDSSKTCGDGRWRMMLYDMDASADIHHGDSALSGDRLRYMLLEPPAEDASMLLPVLRSLLENEQFRRELINALCDVRNIHFELYRTQDEIDLLRSVYEPLMPDSLLRFGPQEIADSDVEDYCDGEMDHLARFFEERYEVFPQLMQEALDLQPPAECTISIDGDGSVMVNHAVPDWSYDFTGHYFPDYPITLTAQESGEGCFVRWEYEGCTLSDPDSPVTEVSFTGDFSICAVFE